jgi:Domain of unknown function (DUF5063)
MNPTHTAATHAFAELARGFCRWCEGSPFAPEPEVMAASWLARLYAAALLLPSVGPENSDGLPDLPEAEVAQAQSNLACFNGDYYREYFDPDPMLDNASGMGDIGDDLLDTYKDIKAGCVLFDRAQPEEALWFWAFLHRIHWGRHAVGALFALHCLSISKR